ncbi:sigma-70 family RNA polymerase sigma factor [Microvirga pudoricolor]|uniref:sigma-70 family RNA polymerase sigma factor n=1 Tax=Microvirga pudoricolor TaxID=2778729 RepID=UPI0019512E33|nr:sigma-70 family RNA polymerase sigma factor [Microvirga pudoricolor]MBM6595054.1 sigma-70 family RNA polymerase sigma factor [Microvirga pudoricolor]
MTSMMPLSLSIQAHIGAHLREAYGDPTDTVIPLKLGQLLKRVTQIIRAHQEPVDQAFTDGIMNALPSLRAFGISLTKSIDRAEDLVQETVLRAISNRGAFEPGTNLQAWMFTILRNSHYTYHRKSKREVEDTDGVFAATLVSIPEQEGTVALHELQLALQRLPSDQREALILTAVDGLSYEAAAEALGVKIGTIKSRINRGRTRLTELTGQGSDNPVATLS